MVTSLWSNWVPYEVLEQEIQLRRILRKQSLYPRPFASSDTKLKDSRRTPPTGLSSTPCPAGTGPSGQRDADRQDRISVAVDCSSTQISSRCAAGERKHYGQAPRSSPRTTFAALNDFNSQVQATAVSRPSTQVCRRSVPSCTVYQGQQSRPQEKVHHAVPMVQVNHAKKSTRKPCDATLLPADDNTALSNLKARHTVTNPTAQFSKVRDKRRKTAQTTTAEFASPNPFAVLNSQAAKKNSTREYSIQNVTSRPRIKQEGITKYERNYNLRKGTPYCRSKPSCPARISQNMSIPLPRAVWSQPKLVSSKRGETSPPSLKSVACKDIIRSSAHNSTGALRTQCTHSQLQMESDTEKKYDDELPDLESSSNTSNKAAVNECDTSSENSQPSSEFKNDQFPPLVKVHVNAAKRFKAVNTLNHVYKDHLKTSSHAHFITAQASSSNQTHTTQDSSGIHRSDDVQHSHATTPTVSRCCTTTATLYNTDTCCFKVYLSDIFQSRQSWPYTFTLEHNGIVEL